MSVKPPRQGVTPPGVIVPATLFAILQQRSFARKKLRHRASPPTQAVFMDPALDHQSRSQPFTIMRMLVASRALQAPGLGAVTQPALQLPFTLASALRAEPERAGLDNGTGGQLGMAQNQVGRSNTSQRLPSYHDPIWAPHASTTILRRRGEPTASAADGPMCRLQAPTEQVSAASRIRQVA